MQNSWNCCFHLTTCFPEKFMVAKRYQTTEILMHHEASRVQTGHTSYRASKRASFWFSRCQPLAATCSVSHLQPLALSATCSHLQPLGSHLAATWQPLGCQWPPSGWRGKWLPSGCRVPSWKKSDFVDFTFFQVCSKWLPNGWLAARGTWLPSGCQVAASGCKWQVAASATSQPLQSWKKAKSINLLFFKIALGSRLQPLATTCSHLAATCPVSHLQQPLGSHLQPLGSHLQPLAATCPVSHLQPLAATWQPLAPSATCSHLAATCSHCATCPVSHLQPLAATCSHLAATWQTLAPVAAASGCQVAAKWLPSGCKWLQVADGASGWRRKWLQVADISKIKLRTSCAHNDKLSTSQTVWNRAGRHTVCLYFGSNSLWQKD